jgi:hypothetical protein
MFFEEYINCKILCYLGVMELYLFKISEVMYAPSCPVGLSMVFLWRNRNGLDVLWARVLLWVLEKYIKL